MSALFCVFLGARPGNGSGEKSDVVLFCKDDSAQQEDIQKVTDCQVQPFTVACRETEVLQVDRVT